MNDDNRKPNSTPLKIANYSASSHSSAEAEPVRRQEMVSLSEVVEHKIEDSQVKQYVEEKPDVPNIAPDIAKAGVRSDAAVKFPNYHTVKLPMSQNKIPTAMKQPVHESVRWLGTLSFYIMEQTKHQFSKTHEGVLKFMKRVLNREIGRFY